MRLSLGKRPNPFSDEDMQVDNQYIGVEDINSFNSMQYSSSINKIKKAIPDDVLNQVKVSSMIFNESHNDALLKMMQNREKANDSPDLTDKIYSCSVCWKEFKIYDPFNDDPQRCNEEDNIELVDEVTFSNNYFCSEWNNIACPTWVSKELIQSQTTCINCFRMDTL